MEPFVNTLVIASAKRGAAERNVILSSFFSSANGTVFKRTSSSIGLGISIIVIFIYYAIMTLTTGLGKGGVMNPLLACIIPNLICLGAGVFLLQKKNA